MPKDLIFIYQGKEYIIVHKYDSGYVEIRDTQNKKVELVHLSELKSLK